MLSKSMIWGGVLVLGFLVGCGTSSVASPAPVLSPKSAKTATSVATATFTAPTLIETPIDDDPLPTFTPFPWPTETAVPLSENDSLYIQLTQKGYKLTSSGSLIGPEGFTYSAHLFINTDSPYYNSLNPATKETIIVAFYRRDGAKDVLLGVQYLPSIDDLYYGNEYADVAGILNWNWQFYVQHQMLHMDVELEADAETRPILKQYNFSSDVNQNGLPEFTVLMQFCVCSKPEAGIQLFEIQNTAVVKNITQNIPKLTLFKPHSKTPFTFYVHDKLGGFSYEYLHYLIVVDRIYAWEGSEFIDVSSRYADEYLAKAEKIISQVKPFYGDSFDKVELPEILLLRILKLYEAAGMSKEGLRVFLDVTDSSHWPGSSNEFFCWLQLARATAQQDVAKNQEFDLSVVYLWYGFSHLDENSRQSFQQAGYDISACDWVKE
jgi:hypothetical protein